MKNKMALSNDYIDFLQQIKNQIKISQSKAIVKVNQEMIILYFNIGKLIYEKQQLLGWGAKVIENLSKDIKSTFPKLTRFSSRNIKRMVRFYKEYEKVPLPVAQLEFIEKYVTTYWNIRI